MQKLSILSLAVTLMGIASFVYGGGGASQALRKAVAEHAAGTPLHRVVAFFQEEKAEPEAEEPATPATPATTQPSEAAKQLLAAASERLAQHNAVRADLIERVSVGDHSFTAKGSYLQGRDLQMKLSFTLEYGGNQGSLLEVCDGQILWTRHDIGNQPQITRRDVRQILEAVRKAGNRPEHILIGDLGLGGVASLLAAFQTDLEFSDPQEDVIDGRPVYILQGRWSDAYLTRWGIDKNADREDLPPLLPEVAHVVLDKETLFPRRIEFLKRLPERKVRKPMLSLEFVNVVVNPPVSDEDFQFIPPDRPTPVDVTNLYLQQLVPSAAQSSPGTSPVPGPQAPPK